MVEIRVISFDLDGTITETSFADSVWLEGIPRLCASKNRVSLETAKRKVQSEYDKVGKQRLEWYDLSYWIKKFNLKASTDELLRAFEDRVRIFPDAQEAIKKLAQRGVKLIIVTNARREFLDAELSKLEVRGHFDYVFSSTSDFGLTKMETLVYEKVRDALGVSFREMVHVGDDPCFDCEVPKSLGISAFYLDRTGKHEGKSVVHSLIELDQKIYSL